MTKSEALKRSIEIAVERGWDMFGWLSDEVVPRDRWNWIVGIKHEGIKPAVVGNEREIALYLYIRKNLWRSFSVNDILFDHQFCKALFGEGDVDWEEDRAMATKELFSGEFGTAAEYDGKKWQYHLQQMVLYEDPLDYLVEYLGKEKA